MAEEIRVVAQGMATLGHLRFRHSGMRVAKTTHGSKSVSCDAMLLFCVALVIFEIRKIQVTDYLPSLAIAPLLTWWWLR